MIDTLAILFTTLSILYVVVRAAELDRTIPWFETDDALPTEEAKRASQRAPGRKPMPHET